ncbi:hypothetical protein [Pedobacter gandavensis]|uniref:hypothetical protein n=1 Tax=Pedobacter gandavensis TaxID=2679963 RepID=UPI00292EE689|nr:hypothetical protein [Pedobacter gandavensis]
MKANLLLIAATFILALSACNKISESIQRDVIIKQDSLLFSIPPMSLSTPSILIDNLPTTVDIRHKIDSATKGEFSLADLKHVKVSNFSITYVPKVRDSVDTKNNFSSISSLMVNLNNGAQRDSLASYINTGSLDQVSRDLALTPVMTEEVLKTYLDKGDLKYSVLIRPRKPTTDTIKAKISASYTLTLTK